jgi:hypothetical protein
MVRSYSMLLTILTVYILIPALGVLGLPGPRAYSVGHVLCLILNLAGAEIVLRRWRHMKPVETTG